MFHSQFTFSYVPTYMYNTYINKNIKLSKKVNYYFKTIPCSYFSIIYLNKSWSDFFHCATKVIWWTTHNPYLSSCQIAFEEMSDFLFGYVEMLCIAWVDIFNMFFIVSYHRILFLVRYNSWTATKQNTCPHANCTTYVCES